MSGWDSGTILVTGAGGFIGSHLVEALAGKGNQVRAFLRYNSRGDKGLLELASTEVAGAIEPFFGDLRDADTVRRATEGVSSVFHLGAHIGIPYSYASPRDVVDTNVLGTFNVLQAALDQGVDRVLQVSTSEVYGSAMYVPMDESHPLQAQSPYSASKIGAEKIAESYFRTFGLKVTVVRPFNNYGPRQSARAIIPTIISQAVSGTEVKIGSLVPRRDFTFVLDTVAGFISLLASEKTVGETVNLGTNTDISVGDVAQMVGRLLNKELSLHEEGARVRPALSEVNRLLADAGKVKALTGWQPEISLEEGLKRTISWIRENAFRYRTDIYAI